MPQGALALLVLRVLRSGPLHGYAIAQRIHALSDEVLKVEEGALYPALHRMEHRGWIDAEWGVSENNRRAKYYRLTALGRRMLRQRTDSWERLVTAVGRVLTTERRLA